MLVRVGDSTVVERHQVRQVHDRDMRRHFGLAPPDAAAVLPALVAGVEFLVVGRGRNIVVMAVPIVQEEEEILLGVLLEPFRRQVRDPGIRGDIAGPGPARRADREVVIRLEALVESEARDPRRAP